MRQEDFPEEAKVCSWEGGGAQLRWEKAEGIK